ncbi:MAG TPA: tetratricopeptide repeat protein, partial [Chitinophagaceae bacterium]|nr:tetratricopeptide repeat protein [Chitinophagaceae bacterium]
MKRVLFILGICWCFSFSSSGQCLGDDSLNKRITAITESKIADAEKLKQLLDLEARLRNCPVSDSMRAYLLAETGKSYASSGEYIEAIHSVRSAISLIRNANGRLGAKPTYLTACYYYLSTFYASLDNKAERIRALDTCIETAIQMKVIDYYLLFGLFNKTKHAYNIGDYENCYRYAEMTEKFAIEYGNDPTKRSYANFYTNSSSGWKVNALLAMKKFDVVIPIYVKRAEEYEKNGFKNYLGMVYEQLAAIEVQKENFDLALNYFKKAFKYESKYGTSANTRTILNNLGLMYSVGLKNPRKGIEFYKKSVNYRSQNQPINRKDSVELVMTLSNLGYAYTKLKQFDSALFYFKQAYEHVEPGWNEISFLKSLADATTKFPAIEYLTKLLISKGECYAEQYSVTHDPVAIKEALRIFSITDKILFRLKNEQSDLISKLFWRKDTRELYESAIKACNIQGNPEEAFYFFERSKAILLDDQLNEQRWTAQKDVLKQSQVKKKILQLERLLMTTEKQLPAYDSIQKELFVRQQELENIQKHIKINNPLYFQYYMDTTSIKVGDIQQRLLKDHDALIEMFWGDSNVYVLMISREKVGLVQLNKLFFDSLSTSFLKYLSNVHLANREYKIFNQISTELNNLIFGNLRI